MLGELKAPATSPELVLKLRAMYLNVQRIEYPRKRRRE
jgi:hypothetical protein